MHRRSVLQPGNSQSYGWYQGGSVGLQLLVILLIAGPTSATLAVDHVPWAPDLFAAQRLAESRGQLILIHFTADSCGPCRAIEANVFSQSTFGYGVGQSFVPVKINATEQRELARQFKVESWPTDVIVTSAGEELHRMTSPQNGQDYLKILQQVAWHHQTHSKGRQLAGYDPSSSFASANRYDAVYGRKSEARNTAGAFTATTPQLVPPALTTPSAQAANAMTNPGGTLPPGVPSMSSPGTGQAPISMENPYLGVNHQSSAAVVNPNAVQTRALVTEPQATSPPQSVIQATGYAGTPGPPLPTSPPPPAMGVQNQAIESTALDGFCAVAVMDEDRWVRGDARWGARHRGRVYLFHDAASQQRFLADPDRYSPALAGYDPVMVTDLGQWLEGRREHGVRYRNQMFLFGSEESLRRFEQSPDRYASFVDEAVRQASLATAPR